MARSLLDLGDAVGDTGSVSLINASGDNQAQGVSLLNDFSITSIDYPSGLASTLSEGQTDWAYTNVTSSGRFAYRLTGRIENWTWEYDLLQEIQAPSLESNDRVKVNVRADLFGGSDYSGYVRYKFNDGGFSSVTNNYNQYRYQYFNIPEPRYFAQYFAYTTSGASVPSINASYSTWPDNDSGNLNDGSFVFLDAGDYLYLSAQSNAGSYDYGTKQYQYTFDSWRLNSYDGPVLTSYSTYDLFMNQNRTVVAVYNKNFDVSVA